MLRYGFLLSSLGLFELLQQGVDLRGGVGLISIDKNKSQENTECSAKEYVSENIFHGHCRYNRQI